MIIRSLVSFTRIYAATVAVSLTVTVGSGHLSLAQAADITLDSVTFKVPAGTVLLDRVIVEGANLTRDEFAKLFSTESSPEIDALAAGLKAARIRIPEITLTESTGNLAFHGFEATGINQGKVEQISVAGMDGVADMPGAGKSQIAARTFQAENADFVAFIHGMRTGNYANLLTHANHVRWDGFDLTFPDSSVKTGDNLSRFHLGSLEVTSSFIGDIPKTTDFQVNNAILLPSKGSASAQALANLGLEKIEFSFRLKGTYDLEAKVFTIDDYSLTVAEAGVVTIQGRLDNIDKAFYGGDKEQRQAAFQNGDLVRAIVSYEDRGLFNRIVSAAAERTNKTAQALKNDWIAKTPQFATGLLGDNPAANKLTAALSSFINDPAKLTISASGSAPVKFSEFKRALLPGLMSRFAIDAAVSK